MGTRGHKLEDPKAAWCHGGGTSTTPPEAFTQSSLQRGRLRLTHSFKEAAHRVRGGQRHARKEAERARRCRLNSPKRVSVGGFMNGRE